MRIKGKNMECGNLTWLLREPTKDDVNELSFLRIKIDGETENLDREPGEGVLINDRLHKDGNYYNTVIMGRLQNN